MASGGPGFDYNLEGSQWYNPSKITYSFAPDGTAWYHGTSNLFSTFNGQYGNGSWLRQMAASLQAWAAVSNINVVMVGDSGTPAGSSGQSQGDPRFGDIRIGGDTGLGAGVTGQTNPPASTNTGSSMPGDVEFNTSFNWTPGAPGALDIRDTALHEVGHALGLAHSPQPTAVMYYQYNGDIALTPYDIEGIQAIYGARTNDVYQAAGLGTSSATAVDLTSRLGSTGATVVTGVSLSTVGDTEYFSVVAPTGASADKLVAVASATGVSSLSPQISVYDASSGMALLGTNGNAAAWGDDAGLTLGSLQAGHRYVIAVTGATSDVFSVGAYDLELSFAPPSQLAPGEGLAVNQPLVSPNGRYELILQTDGNLVEYDLSTNTPVWVSGTNGSGATQVVMQTDGNLVVYAGGTAVFQSGTGGRFGTGDYLRLRDDGYLAVYDKSAPFWTANPTDGDTHTAFRLFTGDSITSPSGRYELILQSDNNLVEYDLSNNSVVWVSATNNTGANEAILQSDGNFVIRAGARVVASTGTSGHPGAFLLLQDDGNLVIYSAPSSGTTVLWTRFSPLYHF